MLCTSMNDGAFRTFYLAVSMGLTFAFVLKPCRPVLNHFAILMYAKSGRDAQRKRQKRTWFELKARRSRTSALPLVDGSAGQAGAIQARDPGYTNFSHLVPPEMHAHEQFELLGRKWWEWEHKEEKPKVRPLTQPLWHAKTRENPHPPCNDVYVVENKVKIAPKSGNHSQH